MTPDGNHQSFNKVPFTFQSTAGGMFGAFSI